MSQGVDVLTSMKYILLYNNHTEKSCNKILQYISIFPNNLVVTTKVCCVLKLICNFACRINPTTVVEFLRNHSPYFRDIVWKFDYTTNERKC